MNPKRANRTLTTIAMICIAVACLIISNVIYTMVTKTHMRSGTVVTDYSSSAERTRIISANRGIIYDRNKEIVAQDVDTYTIYAILDSSHTGIGDVPEYVSDAKLTSEKLAPMLKMSVDEMMNYFTLDENWNLCIVKPYTKTVNTYSHGALVSSVGEYTISEVKIPYRDMVAQYTVPFLFLMHPLKLS